MADKIIQEVLPAVASDLKNNLEADSNFYKKNVQLLAEFQQSLLKKAAAKKEFKHPFNLQQHVRQLIPWLKSADMDYSFLLDEKPWQNLLHIADESLKKLEVENNLPFLEIPAEEATAGYKGYKVFQKIAFTRYEFMRKRSLKKKKKKNIDIGRSFSTHFFVENYVTIPTADYSLNCRRKFLALFSQTLFKLHQAGEILDDDVMQTENLSKEDGSYWALLKEHDPKEAIAAYLEINNELTKNINQLYEEISRQNLDFVSQISDQVSAAWRLAGSPLNPSKSFSEKVISEKWKRLDKKLSKEKVLWENHFTASKEEWLKDLELAELKLTSVDIYQDTLNLLNDKLNNKIAPIFSQIKTDLNNSIGIFEKGKTVDEEELRKKIMLESRNLVKELRQNSLPQLLDNIIQANMGQAFQGFAGRLEVETGNLAKSYVIFKERDMENIPPDSDTDPIPIRKIVTDEILSASYKESKNLEKILSQDMENTIRKLSSIDQIIEFNLEAAYDLLKESEKKENNVEEARNVAFLGIERSIGTLQDIQQKIDTDISRGTEHFSRIAQKFENDLQKLADSERILELNLRLTRARTKEKVLNTRNKVVGKITSFFPKIIHYFKLFTEKINNTIFKFRKAALLGKLQQEDGDHITRFLIQTYKKIQAMPYIYQRLFQLQPLDEKRFFSGRDNSFSLLQADFENFKSGYQAQSAIVAEKGNGKTTLLVFGEKDIFKGFIISRMIFSKTIYKKAELLEILKEAFSVPKINSFEELEIYINDLPEKRICIAEDIHKMFLRVIDGFEAMERFLLFISNTRSKIFWIVSCGMYAWEYLDKVIKISDYFKRVIMLKSLAVDEIKDVILKRHQVSGFGLNFEEPQKVLKSRQYKKLTREEDKKEFLMNNFFEELCDISGGNIKSSIFFWLSTLKEFDEEKINVAESIDLDHTILYTLSADEYFSFAALIQHEYLNYGQHALIFNQEVDTSRSMLGRLHKKGFLEKKNEVFSIHPLLFLPILRVLKAKNFFN